MNQHKKFILTPVSTILEEAILSIKHIGSGIETYPLSDYLMQSIFIKMTGAQEQKMKCIAWELATNDFDFRRDFMEKFNVEFSRYDDKNRLYKELFNQINSIEKCFILDEDTKTFILNNSFIDNYLSGSNLSIWSNQAYQNYIKIWKTIKLSHFANQPSVLLTKQNGGKLCLQNIYEEHLYRNRNRIAHNTKSYQQNLPTLERLKKEDYQYENYFLWLSILILIDNIFTKLYENYLKTLEKKRFM